MTGEFVIKQAGFYRELGGHGHETASAPSLRDAARSSGDWDEDRLVAYLEASHEIYTTMGAERDVIADDVWITGAGSLVTDGTFCVAHKVAFSTNRYVCQIVRGNTGNTGESSRPATSADATPPKVRKTPRPKHTSFPS